MAVTLNDKYLKGVVNADELKGMEPMVKVAHEMIENKNGLGNDFLGWVDLPVNYDKEEFERIKKAAAKIKADSEVLIVRRACSNRYRWFLPGCKSGYRAFKKHTLQFTR